MKRTKNISSRNSNQIRCSWPSNDPLMIEYHDTEWGTPCYNDQKLFEYIVLDTFQAGLSWRTILHKRENFRKAFSNFNAKKISKYGAKEVDRLMKDVGIIRNKLKITGTITNAIYFLRLQKEHGNFSTYIWQFTGGKPILHAHKRLNDIGATSKESDIMSQDMKKKGFKFVGSTICYAFMQGAGMVNDHVVSCFRYKAVQKE